MWSTHHSREDHQHVHILTRKCSVVITPTQLPKSMLATNISARCWNFLKVESFILWPVLIMFKHTEETVLEFGKDHVFAQNMFQLPPKKYQFFKASNTAAKFPQVSLTISRGVTLTNVETLCSMDEKSPSCLQLWTSQPPRLCCSHFSLSAASVLRPKRAKCSVGLEADRMYRPGDSQRISGEPSATNADRCATAFAYFICTQVHLKDDVTTELWEQNRMSNIIVNYGSSNSTAQQSDVWFPPLIKTGGKYTTCWVTPFNSASLTERQFWHKQSNTTNGRTQNP